MAVRELFEAVPRRDWDAGPDGTVRMAIVGLGTYARESALPAMAAGEYCEPAVVVTGTPEKRTVAEEYEAEALDYEAFADGEAADAYDAVYVATPNALHLPQAETAASLGKHVICEKPLEASLERAERLVAACEDAGVTLMTAYRLQVDPAYRRLREFVRAGGIGDPVAAHGNFSFPVLDVGGPDQWRLDPDLAGGGAMMDVGVYPSNTTRFLVDADPVAVEGSTRPGSFEDVDAAANFQLHFPGFVGSFSGTNEGHGSATLSLVGTDGRIEVDDAFWSNRARRIAIERDDGAYRDGRVVLERLGANEVRDEFDYFAHCVLTGEEPEPDGRDGLADVRIADAVYAAAERGERVGL